MTSRVRHLTITLDADIREDDLVPIISALEHIRGVAGVEQHVVRAGDLLARHAVRAEVQQKLHQAIDDVFRNRESLEGIENH